MSILIMVMLMGQQDVTFNTSAICSSLVICPGEELVYEVSWLSIGLGQIRLHTHNVEIDGNAARYKASMDIDSYKLPVADIHSTSHIEMDTLFNSRAYHSVEWKGDHWTTENYHYDLSAGLIVVERDRQNSRTSKPLGPATFDTLRMMGRSLQDGLSLVYFARAYVHRRDTLRVPTIVYGKQGSTTFYFGGERENITIDALNKPVHTIFFSGLAEFDGIFGLTGEFSGWFSDDVAAVPIKAQMKVLIGNITIELIQWKRSHWNPPEDVER